MNRIRYSFTLLFFLITLSEFQAQEWTKRSDLPLSARRNNAGFSIDGKGYVCSGGEGPQLTDQHFDDLVEYDPISDSWTAKANFPSTPRRNIIAFAIDSFAYVGLGWNNTTTFFDLLRYNAKTDIWDTVSSYPGQSGRECFAASYDGKGYVGGGSIATNSSSTSRDFWEYDPTTDTWTSLGNFPFGNRRGGVSFRIDTLLYFGMGADESSTLNNDLWSYNPANDTWTQLASLPGPVRFEPCHFVADGKAIVGAGTGQSSSNILSDYYEYDPATDTWTLIQGFCLGGRSRAAYFSIGDLGYIATGVGANGNLKDLWEYNPSKTANVIDTGFCQGDSIVLDFTQVNSTYLWQDNSTKATFIIKQAGTYWVRVTDTSINCSSSDTIKVSELTNPSVILGSDTTLCSGRQLLLNAFFPGASYVWQDNTTNAAFNVASDGKYWVDVTLGNCTATDTINVAYTFGPSNFDLGPDTMICERDSIVLDAFQLGADYLWQDNSTGSGFNVKNEGKYWVDVEIGGCIATDTINVGLKALPAVDLGNDTAICEGDQLVLDATNQNATYLWQDGSTNSGFTASDPDIYFVRVELNSCIRSDTIIITHIDELVLALGNDTTICDGEFLSLDATLPNSTYLWNDASTNSNLIVSTAGSFSVEVSSACQVLRDTIEVNTSDCNCRVIMPNVFTPNGDQINDLYLPIIENCQFIDYQFIIYNRWGNRVFFSNDEELGWNGRIKDEKASTGMYSFSLKYSTGVDSEVRSIGGSFLLTR